ncbi:MAG: alginate export family protein [Phycisphaerae bacterium]|jgi:hypothetical protein
MRSSLAILPPVLVWLVAATVAPAQEAATSGSFLQQQRTIDDKLRDERRELAPLSSALDLQWGGWLEYYAFHFDDGVQRSRYVQRPGLAFWTRASIDDGTHEIFARVRLHYTHFRCGDQIGRQKDWWGPNFDRAWYQVDIGRALHFAEPGDPFQLKARIGRQSVLFGTGYALDMPLDAVVLEGRLHDFLVTGLVGRTIGSYPNIDRSNAVDTHSDRLFYGVQVAYDGWDRHRPFVYALWNNDRTDERPRTFFQNYQYDSFYLGFGARGELAHNLNYWAEGVFESGHSYGDGDWLHRDYVEAFGWDVGVEYLFDLPMRPRLAAEYMFASGDADRLFSPTNAEGGNRGDTRDTSFVGFGYRDTGLATGLTPSNLHIWRAGASLAPLEQIELLHDLEIGTNWFLYHKNRSRAAISDFTAEQFEGYVGWEMDYFINWRLASDVSWTTRWGVFFPGDAYQDCHARHFIFTGLTWSF